MALATGYLDNLPEFVRKLWQMVQNDSWNEIIKWNENGTGFLLCEEEKFPKEKDPIKKDPPKDTAEKESIEWRVVSSGILKSYFKHNSFGSFQKQLSNYSIHKNNDTKVYQHDLGYFNKNHPELLKDIIHKKKQKQVLAGLATVMSVDLTGAAASRNPINVIDTGTFTDVVPRDLRGVNPGHFGDFETNLEDTIEVVKNIQFAEIQDQNKVPFAAAQGSERYDPGYVSSAGCSSQDQELNQGTAVTTEDNRNPSELYDLPAPAARTSKSQTVYSSEEESSSGQQVTSRPKRALFKVHQVPATAAKPGERSSLAGSSSQDQELRKKAGITIDPKSGPLQGGTAVRLDNIPFDGPVMLIFGTKEVPTCTLPHGGTNIWLAVTPAGDKLGEVTVTAAIAATDTRDYLGDTVFTYEPDDQTKKKTNERKVSDGNRERKRILSNHVNDVGKMIKQFKKDYCSGGNGSLGSQQGSPNRATQLQLQDILKLLVYAAAETGARELIDVLFSLLPEKIVFEAYKNECPLPENIAEDNGHKEIAAYLRGITERYSDEDCTSPGQPKYIDWLALANAFKEINLVPTDPSGQDSRQICEDNISETGYSGDGETSSSGSERESSDCDHEYKRITVCKGNPFSVVHEECEVLLESPILHFEANSSCSSLLEQQRTPSEEEELMEHMRKAGHFSAGETKNDSRYLGSVADCNSKDNNSVEEEKEGETQRGNESYLEGESCCTGTDRPSCDLLELPGSDLEEKMQRTSHQEMLERNTGYLGGKDLQYLGGGVDCNSEYSNTEERKKEDELQHGYESFLEGECCYASVKGPPCDSLEPLRNADSDDKIQGKPDQGFPPTTTTLRLSKARIVILHLCRRHFDDIQALKGHPLYPSLIQVPYPFLLVQAVVAVSEEGSGEIWACNAVPQTDQIHLTRDGMFRIVPEVRPYSWVLLSGVDYRNNQLPHYACNVMCMLPKNRGKSSTYTVTFKLYRGKTYGGYEVLDEVQLFVTSGKHDLDKKKLVHKPLPRIRKQGFMAGKTGRAIIHHFQHLADNGEFDQFLRAKRGLVGRLKGKVEFQDLLLAIELEEAILYYGQNKRKKCLAVCKSVVAGATHHSDNWRFILSRAFSIISVVYRQEKEFCRAMEHLDMSAELLQLTFPSEETAHNRYLTAALFCEKSAACGITAAEELEVKRLFEDTVRISEQDTVKGFWCIARTYNRMISFYLKTSRMKPPDLCKEVSEIAIAKAGNAIQTFEDNILDQCPLHQQVTFYIGKADFFVRRATRKGMDISEREETLKRGVHILHDAMQISHKLNLSFEIVALQHRIQTYESLLTRQDRGQIIPATTPADSDQDCYSGETNMDYQIREDLSISGAIVLPSPKIKPHVRKLGRRRNSKRRKHRKRKK